MALPTITNPRIQLTLWPGQHFDQTCSSPHISSLYGSHGSYNFVALGWCPDSQLISLNNTESGDHSDHEPAATEDEQKYLVGLYRLGDSFRYTVIVANTGGGSTCAALECPGIYLETDVDWLQMYGDVSGALVNGRHSLTFAGFLLYADTLSKVDRAIAEFLKEEILEPVVPIDGMPNNIPDPDQHQVFDEKLSNARTAVEIHASSLQTFVAIIRAISKAQSIPLSDVQVLAGLADGEREYDTADMGDIQKRVVGLQQSRILLNNFVTILNDFMQAM